MIEFSAITVTAIPMTVHWDTVAVIVIFIMLLCTLLLILRKHIRKEKEIKERVPYVLELVGLEDKMNRHPNEMSGGEQQRLAIARALVNNPSTIIADEPTGNLDPNKSLEIMSLLQEINNLGTTMLVVTHAKDLVERFRKRVIAIDEGLIVSDGMDGYFDYEDK